MNLPTCPTCDHHLDRAGDPCPICLLNRRVTPTPKTITHMTTPNSFLGAIAASAAAAKAGIPHLFPTPEPTMFTIRNFTGDVITFGGVPFMPIGDLTCPEPLPAPVLGTLLLIRPEQAIEIQGPRDDLAIPAQFTRIGELIRSGGFRLNWGKATLTNHRAVTVAIDPGIADLCEAMLAAEHPEED